MARNTRALLLLALLLALAGLVRWQTTITASPRKMCTGQMNPRTKQVEVRCR